MAELEKREVVSTGDDFPAGMKVLVVDDNKAVLRIVSTMLRKCHYDVTECGDPKQALEILREKKGNFDLVLTDVQMPDMDGFKLLEIVGLEMDLPVILISIDLSIEKVKKAVLHGACDFYSKPLKMETVKFIWQHVLRRKKLNKNNDNNNNNDNEIKNDKKNESASRSVKKRKGATGEDDNNGEDENGEDRKNKKKRFQWTDDLHKMFVNAIRQLGGINDVVPKKILALMKDIPGLTREHVASHLQKYRQSIQKLEKAERDQGHNSQLLTSQTLAGQRFAGQSQPILSPKPLANYCPYPKPSAVPNLFQAQNSLNAPALVANSHIMPLMNFSRHQQPFQPNSLVLNSGLPGFGNTNNNYAAANNNITTGYNNNNMNNNNMNQFVPNNGFNNNNMNHIGANSINNGFPGFRSGASGSPVVFLNNDGNVNINGNGLMGVNTPIRYVMDNESLDSNLTFSNNCGENINNSDCYYNI